MNQTLKDKNAQSVNKFKDKFETFKTMIQKDGDKYLKLKNQTSVQVQSLQDENFELLAKVEEQVEVIGKLRREKAKQQATYLRICMHRRLTGNQAAADPPPEQSRSCLA